MKLFLKWYQIVIAKNATIGEKKKKKQDQEYNLDVDFISRAQSLGISHSKILMLF
jgi:hypothetical protein